MAMKPYVVVEHQSDQRRFVILADGGTAVLEYRIQGNQLTALHTGVPPALRGKGLAERLTRALIEHCRTHGLLLVPQCSYTAAFVERHPDLVQGILHVS